MRLNKYSAIRPRRCRTAPEITVKTVAVDTVVKCGHDIGTAQKTQFANTNQIITMSHYPNCKCIATAFFTTDCQWSVCSSYECMPIAPGVGSRDTVAPIRSGILPLRWCQNATRVTTSLFVIVVMICTRNMLSSFLLLQRTQWYNQQTVIS